MAINIPHIQQPSNSSTKYQSNPKYGNGRGKGRTHSRDRKLLKEKLWRDHREGLMEIESRLKEANEYNLHNLIRECYRSIVPINRVPEILEAMWEYQGKEQQKKIKNWSNKKIGVPVKRLDL